MLIDYWETHGNMIEFGLVLPTGNIYFVISKDDLGKLIGELQTVYQSPIVTEINKH